MWKKCPWLGLISYTREGVGTHRTSHCRPSSKRTTFGAVQWCRPLWEDRRYRHGKVLMGTWKQSQNSNAFITRRVETDIICDQESEEAGFLHLPYSCRHTYARKFRACKSVTIPASVANFIILLKLRSFVQLAPKISFFGSLVFWN